MSARPIEILALKLAQAEANLAITQAQLEETRAELQQLKEAQNDGNADT